MSPSSRHRWPRLGIAGRGLQGSIGVCAWIVVCASAKLALAGPPMGGGGMGGGGMGGGGMGGGGMGGMGPMGPGQGPKKDDKDGPAEEAPKDKKALDPVEPIPAQPQGARRIQLFELHGYMRMRTDYFRQLDMGLVPTSQSGLVNNYFKPPLQQSELDEAGNPTSNQANCSEQLAAGGVNQTKAGIRCGRRKGFSSANMRLRLEPTLHITDTVRVYATIDALDNLVLGSTPDSYAGQNPWAPIDLYTRSQVPPNSGINSFNDSLTVKRAWGHMHFGWGLDVKFGRMPQHWGMGMLYNDGNGYDRRERADIVRMLDMDYGDSVDSLRLGYDFGKDKRRIHTLSASYDWASSGPTTAQLMGPSWASSNFRGQEYSVEKYDNVHQLSVSILRRDDSAMLTRKTALGEPVINYGAIAYLRWQKTDRAIGSPNVGDGLGGNPIYEDPILDPDGLNHDGAPLGNGGLDEEGNGGLQNYAASLVLRRGLIFTPDVWLRISWRTLRVELEGAAVMGRFHHRDLRDNPTTDVDFSRVVADAETKIQSGGYALEFKYGIFDDTFHIGLDHGFATGDQTPHFALDYSSPWLQSEGVGLDAGNAINNTFRFNPAYMQDLMLFREIMGTVANATYFKPWAAYYFFQKNASARLDIEYALGSNREGTPSGKASYGMEVDASVRYHDTREPVFVQFQYGVMFPFGAFTKVPNASSEQKHAAQTLQAQIGIRF